MLHSSDLEFLMEAHNGIAAKIIQEAGIALFFFFFFFFFEVGRHYFYQ